MALALTACHSKIYDLNSLVSSQPTVLIFLAADCPISQRYIPRINQLSNRYPQVRFVGVFSTRESNAGLQEYRKANHIRFTTVLDHENALSQQLGATHTPEAFLLSSSKQVIYHGAIDNWYYNLEQLYLEPTDHFLQNAMESHLRQKPVFLKDTRPVGCLIEQ